MRWLAVLFVILASLRPLAAEPIAGQSDPAFVAALEAWLQDDEASALPVLADLAGSGNSAAQLLLGLLDKRPELQGPWLSSMSREDRIGVMRAPGGISGRNWLHAAARSVPLAALWLRLQATDATPGLVLEMAQAGEPRAARVAVLALRSRQERGLETIAGAPDFPAAMRFAVWEAALPGAGLEALGQRAGAEAENLEPGDPQREMAGLSDDPNQREGWFRTSAVAEPIDALCTALCPETWDTCTEAALISVGGYRGLMSHGSPVEALIDTDRFAASTKAQSGLLRAALLRWSGGARELFIGRATGWDACLGAALQAENDRTQ